MRKIRPWWKGGFVAFVLGSTGLLSGGYVADGVWIYVVEKQYFVYLFFKEHITPVGRGVDLM
ncbi:hypothetical protein B4Q04_15180 [Zobellia sp. OII3]|nr:hypothetical protein B4Q04_15180 [Zobellia sp. OII3]